MIAAVGGVLLSFPADRGGGPDLGMGLVVTGLLVLALSLVHRAFR